MIQEYTPTYRKLCLQPCPEEPTFLCGKESDHADDRHEYSDGATTKTWTKVELPPYDERCKEEIAVASRKEMGAIYTIYYYKAALDSRERQLLAALADIAALKARLQK